MTAEKLLWMGGWALRRQAGGNLDINYITQQHCNLMEEVKRNEMERRAGGGIAGLDMFVMFRG